MRDLKHKEIFSHGSVHQVYCDDPVFLELIEESVRLHSHRAGYITALKEAIANLERDLKVDVLSGVLPINKSL